VRRLMRTLDGATVGLYPILVVILGGRGAAAGAVV
jgi:hypothetical protein